MPRPECTAPDCSRPQVAAALCGTHYKRLRRTGSIADPITGEDIANAALRSDTDDCILWDRACDSAGYAVAHIKGHTVKVHTWVCRNAHGDAPPQTECAHACGVRNCINPRHLRWLTHADNVRESARLTDSDVARIRSSGESAEALAKELDVHLSTVHRARRGATWENLNAKHPPQQ